MTDNKQMNLCEKLIEIRRDVPYLQKNKEGHNYRYVNGTTVLGSLKAKMDELSILLVPSVTEFTVSSFLTKKEQRKEIVNCKMVYTWINASNPEDRMDVPFACFGSQDDISKAFGSALTYSERYFMLKFFNIPTDEVDPDAFQNKYGHDEELKDWTQADEDKKAKADAEKLKKEGIKPINGPSEPSKPIKAETKVNTPVKDNEFKKSYIDGVIERLDKFNFTVKSATNSKEQYNINLKDKKCNCIAFKSQGTIENKTCKHLSVCRVIANAEAQGKIELCKLDDMLKDPELAKSVLNELLTK